MFPEVMEGGKRSIDIQISISSRAISVEQLLEHLPGMHPGADDGGRPDRETLMSLSPKLFLFSKIAVFFFDFIPGSPRSFSMDIMLLIL